MEKMSELYLVLDLDIYVLFIVYDETNCLPEVSNTASLSFNHVVHLTTGYSGI